MAVCNPDCVFAQQAAQIFGISAEEIATSCSDLPEDDICLAGQMIAAKQDIEALPSADEPRGETQ